MKSFEDPRMGFLNVFRDHKWLSVRVVILKIVVLWPLKRITNCTFRISEWGISQKEAEILYTVKKGSRVSRPTTKLSWAGIMT